MGDLSEQQIEPLAAAENSEDLWSPPSPATTSATPVPASEPKKKKGKLGIFSRCKPDEVDESAKTATVPKTVAESSRSGATAAPVEEAVTPDETADDAASATASRRLSVNLNDVNHAGASSFAPLPREGVAPSADPDFSVPTLNIAPATPRVHYNAELVNGDLIRALYTNRSDSRRARGSRTGDNEPKYPLKISEEPGDYPHINGPRNVKCFGRLPYVTHRIYIPLARHWVSHRPIARYAGDPLFKLSKACPYILVPQVLAARLQLIVETPFIIPDEVKELAAERGLDVASLEGYDIALLTILGVKIEGKKEPDYEDHRLALYFLRRHGIAHLRYCNILEFIEHIKRWRQIPNPAHLLELGISGQGGGCITWTYIVQRMKDLDIDPAKLDMEFYQGLIEVKTYRDLTARLLKLKEMAEDGTLDERFQKWDKVRDKRLYDWQTTIMAEKKNDPGMNNRRFSHRHPMGIAMDDPRADPSLQAFLEAKKAEAAFEAAQAAAEAAVPDSPLLPPSDEEQLQAQKQAKKKWYVTCWAAPLKAMKGWGWSYIVYSLLVLLPLIGGFTWASMGGGENDKFTDHHS
ncbi:uncharacterized protein M421DRAFT_7935 [Didymella exigua CBS 183.55]|uniref:Uncharacterized protein n=1 Tax=Didymella exigua CBS 183.55 TaxID=1150837 RepID=A0A6A5RB48_9PLEO|nr:uncharacterized protein M421DRAFT_7935 [Didymella exigua CBS 183.55]KAF1925461.1 hypothetical protein M421DRAFT_7935 [Didymella exigua CBS 183.55]